MDSGDQRLELERFFDDASCVTPSAARRRGGTPVISASGAPWKISPSSAGSCAGPADPATIRSLSTAAGSLPSPRPVARGAHVTHQRGREPGLAQHLDHEPTDVDVVFDDENYFSGH